MILMIVTGMLSVIMKMVLILVLVTLVIQAMESFVKVCTLI